MNEIKRPLEGIKVVELATFIAAPCCARYLADLGAEVIKVEAPAGDPLRYTAVNEGRPQDQKENTSYDLENANKTCVVLQERRWPRGAGKAYCRCRHFHHQLAPEPPEKGGAGL